MTAVRTDAMAQPTSSNLPRNMVAPEFDMSDSIGEKRKVLIVSRGCGPSGAGVERIGGYLTCEEYLSDRHQRMNAVGAASSGPHGVPRSAPISPREEQIEAAKSLSIVAPVLASNAVVRLTPRHTIWRY